jgi:hypothetical protein
LSVTVIWWSPAGDRAGIGWCASSATSAATTALPSFASCHGSRSRFAGDRPHLAPDLRRDVENTPRKFRHS